MSKINAGRLLFCVGVLVLIGCLVLIRMSPGTDPARYSLALWFGGIAAALGMGISLFRREEAEADRLASGEWGDWDEFTQIRRPEPEILEFRSASPFCMLAGAGFVLGAAFTAWWAAVFGVMLILVGSGTVIDGTLCRVRVWRGWIYWPLFFTEFGASEIDSVTISRQLGMDPSKTDAVDLMTIAEKPSPDPSEVDAGGMAGYVLCIVDRDGDRTLLKACSSLKEARALAVEIRKLLGVQILDETDSQP